jgi:glycosyltransferase involved in cell wall biosynthesis
MVAYAFYENDARIRRYAESLIAKGMQVEVIALRKKRQPPFEVISGVSVYRIQQRERNEKNKWDYLFRILLFLLRSFYFLSIHHVRSPYSLIHVHSVPDFEVFAALVPKLTGAKIILDIHDLVPEFYGNKFNVQPDSFIVNALIFIEKVCCAFADHVIIANDIWSKKLCERSVKPEKCTPIINYPNLRIFSQLNSRKSNSEDFSLIYPGSLNRHQGLDIAIKAMALVREEIFHARFHIYGEGPEREKLKALITDLRLNNIVLLHDPVSLSEIADRMASSDAGIVPKRADSFGNEAFSTKVMEFMAMGVPVIVSDTDIDRFYFNESLLMFFKSGDERDLAEKIITLYRNKELRIKLMNNGLDFIKENNWQVKDDLYLQIISALLGGEGLFKPGNEHPMQSNTKMSAH